VADTSVNVSGSDQVYSIDAFTVPSGDYRQVVVIGDSDSSGTYGDSTSPFAVSGSVSVSNFPPLQNVSGTSLDNIHTKLGEIDTAIDTIDGVLDNILTKNTEIDTAIDTIDGVVDSIKTNSDSAVANTASKLDLSRKVVNLDPAGLEVQTGSGGLEASVTITDYPTDLISVLVDLDANGDNPTADEELIAAPGAGNKIVIYGYQLMVWGTAASAYGNWVVTNGAISGAKYLIAGRSQGLYPSNTSNSLPIGLACDENTALNITTTEGSGNTYIYGTVHYRIEST